MAPALRLPIRLSAGAPVLAGLAILAALAAGLAVASAQVDGERGIAVVTASSDIDVGGIEVDATGDTAEEARQNGWQEAQRMAWERLDGPDLSDSQIQSLVSAVVIERERISDGRYIATLGVIFDRVRAGRYLGSGGRQARSAPMLLVPVTFSGGTELVYEQRNPWQRAWAEYQSGSSRIDYVRPSGAGGVSLLVTYGQTGRRSRIWWRNVLDQFGAADVLVPIARIDYSYPGGPVSGTFTARHGPDNLFLDSFTLSADSPEQLPAMMTQAVRRFDDIFEAALAAGVLRPDPTLDQGGGSIDPRIEQLIEAGRAAEAQERAARAARSAAAARAASDEGATPAAEPTPVPLSGNYVVQFATPTAGAVDAIIAGVNATPGVRGTATSSLAIGGTSIMRVTFAGSLDQLAAALRARGFTVTQGGNALAISR